MTNSDLLMNGFAIYAVIIIFARILDIFGFNIMPEGLSIYDDYE